MMEGNVLVAKGSATMTLAKDEQNHISSSNRCFARASSAALAGQVDLAMSKPQVAIPESQLTLKNDLELIRAQLHAQTKAFQALSHSITLLEQESNHQQGRINELEEDQEVDITRNLVSIKKMQENQMKCTKFLCQLRGKIPEDALEAVDNKPGTEELNEIWSAVNTLRNSIVNNSIRSDKRNSSRMKDRGSRHHRKTNSPGSNFSDSALYQHRHSSSEHSS
ncbi:coiled-coil domain-containing protein 159 isoform 2-T2 [Liasis olivaceus]